MLPKQWTSRRQGDGVARDGERGIALVVVLWMSLLIAAIAGGFILDSRTSTRVARNNVDNALAVSIAEGGVHLAVFRLLDPDPDRRWHQDGRRYATELEGAALEIVIQDEAGKVDLNQGNPVLLEGLFAAAGLEAETTQALMQAILARRTVTGDAAPRRFAAVDGLRSLQGMSDALFARLRPALTVYGDGYGLHMMSAPRLALRAIPGVTAEDAEAFVAERYGAESSAALAKFLDVGQVREFRLDGVGPFVSITVHARTASGARATRRAIVEVTGDLELPFIIREWRADGDGPDAPA
jgi:general secretion pathway protein K